MCQMKNKVHDGDEKNKKHPEKDYLVCGDERVKNEHGFCLQRAGWGTDHLGTGRCKLHGGKSTGPKDKSKLEKNKNAVTTGEYETIWLECLTEEEQEKYQSITTDLVEQLNEEIKLTTFREFRMMQRIAKLAKVEFTVVEKTIKSKGTEDSDKSSVAVSEKEEKVLATLGQIQGIEEALTRVQGKKSRLLKLKHQIEDDGEGDKEDRVADFFRKLRKSAKDGS